MCAGEHKERTDKKGNLTHTHDRQILRHTFHSKRRKKITRQTKTTSQLYRQIFSFILCEAAAAEVVASLPSSCLLAGLLSVFIVYICTHTYISLPSFFLYLSFRTPPGDIVASQTSWVPRRRSCPHRGQRGSCHSKPRGVHRRSPSQGGTSDAVRGWVDWGGGGRGGRG
jgi:hypothetical protein